MSLCVGQNIGIIAELSTKLNELQALNKRMNMRVSSHLINFTCSIIFFFTELEKRVEELETMHNCFLLQVTGDGKEWAFVNQETSIDLSFPSKGIPPISLSLGQLSCQLTDPLNEQVPCSITSTQPGVCTVMYTPTIRGPHQLRIKIKDTDIQGSPFRVSVLPEADRVVMQHTITKVKDPQRVAVSKSGEVVVCHELGRCISVFNKKEEKKLSFRSVGECSYVAITTYENHILAISNRQIVKYTMEGKHVISVECTNDIFHKPSGIAVHPSRKVIVTGSCIQVLNPDLSHSHLFDVCSHGAVASHVACDNDGVVYAAGRDCIRSFSIDGQCISKCLYNVIPGTFIVGICIDSTNTLYALDGYTNRMSVISNSGKFIKFLKLCLGENERNKSLAGISVDNTTGALYVCASDHIDTSKHCVIVY